MPSRPPTPPAPARRLVSLVDAAAYLRITVSTLRRWISRGVLPGYKYGDRLVRVDLNDIDALETRMPTAKHGEVNRAAH